MYAFLSYVCPLTRVVYVQKESPAFRAMEKCMEEAGPFVEQQSPAGGLEREKLYLAKHQGDGSFYRAVVTSPESGGERKEVFFVDYGNSATVLKSEIWEVTVITEPPGG